MEAGPEIEQIGRDAAQAVVGDGVVDNVEIRQGWNMSDEPTYEFFFRVHPELIPFSPGLVHIRLTQQLLGALAKRGDGHRPVVHLLSPADWLQMHA